MNFPLALSLSALGFSALSHPARAYILCDRQADVEVAFERPTSKDDPCTGLVTIQGISYQCGKLSEVDAKRTEYLDTLTIRGQEVCEETCGRRGSFFNKCYGHFTPPQQCGFTVPAAQSEIYGRQIAACNPECGGVAFAYCSIYRGNVLQIDPEHLAGANPNCFCHR